MLEPVAGGMAKARTEGPALLVSVRHGLEARTALIAGCDWLDIKDPAQGSLGMAAPAAIRDVVETRHRLACQIPLSAACGETVQWEETGTKIPPLPDAIALAKLGTAGLVETRAARCSRKWVRRWIEVRRRFDEAAGRPLGWVAVGYADWRSASAPSPEAVMEAAVETGCRGLLVDTSCKRSGRLFELVTVEELSRWVGRMQAAGLFAAVAGRLRFSDCERIGQVRPDVVAVRSAVCRGGDRAAVVDAGRIRQFRRALETVAYPLSVPATAGSRAERPIRERDRSEL